MKKIQLFFLGTFILLTTSLLFAQTSHQTMMYVAGTFSAWTLSSNPMSLENGIWVARDVEIPEGEHCLKFANITDWSGDDWGHATGLTGTARKTTGGGNNIDFTIPTGGTFDIYFDDINLHYAIGSLLTDIEDTETTNQISIYPNPVQNLLTINLVESFDEIRLMDRMGKTVLSKTSSVSSFEVEVSHLPTGIYFLQLMNGKYLYSERIFIE